MGTSTIGKESSDADTSDTRLQDETPAHIPDLPDLKQEGCMQPGTWEARDLRAAWWCCFWLNMSVLWSYQSLVSAQNVYMLDYPAANISFYGTVSVGLAMVVGQIINVCTCSDERCNHSTRVIPAYIAFAVLGVFLFAFPSASMIISAFAITGVLNTCSESPLYSIAALWPSGALTAAMNLGNGSAGTLNVALNVLIRLFVEACQDSNQRGSALSQELAMKIFVGVSIAVSISCIPVYLYLIRIPTIMQRRTVVVDMPVSDKIGVTLSTKSAALRRAAWAVAPCALCQFWVFFISLASWPGAPCSATPTGWFLQHRSWYCSPGIIAAFNTSDWLGRALAMSSKVALLLPPNRLMWISAARTCLWPWIVICSRSGANSLLVLVSVFLLGGTNGLLGTLSMMYGPLSVELADRANGSALMVLALYTGIAAGSVFAACVNSTG